MSKRVLVVDDDRLVLSAARRALYRAGFEVVVAASVSAARALLPGNYIDVAILDYFLAGDERGSDLVAPLRAHSAKIRIIVVSGLGDDPQLVRRAHRLGADAVESKTRVDWAALARGDGASDQYPLLPAVDLEALKRDAILGLFLVHHRNVSSTARALGVHRTNLRRLLRKILGPDPPLEEDE